MRLRPLCIDDQEQALQGHSELALEKWDYLLGYEIGTPWLEYLNKLENESTGTNLEEGRVPATFLIAEVNGNLVGRTSIRHELNSHLFNFGGHIGYGVRPDFRRRGFAKEILRQSLSFIYKIGVKEVLLTCDEDNLGSRNVIESQGGVLENSVEYKSGFIRRYWIKKSN